MNGVSDDEGPRALARNGVLEELIEHDSEHSGADGDPQGLPGVLAAGHAERRHRQGPDPRAQPVVPARQRLQVLPEPGLAGAPLAPPPEGARGALQPLDVGPAMGCGRDDAEARSAGRPQAEGEGLPRPQRGEGQGLGCQCPD